MTSKTFTIVGTSLLNGISKVRFANDLVTRFKMLQKTGHVDINLYELPEPMTKPEACQWLSEQDHFVGFNADEQYAVISRIEEYAKKSAKEVKISLEEIADRPVVDTVIEQEVA